MTIFSCNYPKQEILVRGFKQFKERFLVVKYPDDPNIQINDVNTEFGCINKPQSIFSVNCQVIEPGVSLVEINCVKGIPVDGKGVYYLVDGDLVREGYFSSNKQEFANSDIGLYGIAGSINLVSVIRCA